MVSKIPFTKYESVILLYYYLKEVSGDLTRSDSVKKCSQTLRSLAVNSGAEIDDSFRNVSGISFQMAGMESAYRGETILKPASKLFQETAWLYRNDNSTYQRLLEEALGIAVPRQNAKEKFLEWLSAHTAPGRLSDYYIALADVEELSHKKNLFKGPIFEVTDPVVTAGIVRAVNSDRIFKFIHRQNFRSITEVAQLFHRYTKEVNNSDKQIKTNSTASLRGESSTARQDDADNTVEEKDKLSEEAAQTRSIEDTIALDFSQITSFIKREPFSISYFGECFPATSWQELYVIACEKLADDYPVDFDAMLKDTENHIIHGVSSARYMSKPAIINDLYCVETMKSTANLIADLKTLLDNCRVDYENLVIYCKNDLEDEEDVKLDAATTVKNEDWILSQLQAKDITYRDNRKVDGCLWIVGGHELESFINECKWKGYVLHFKPDGCNAFPGKQVWWTKSKSTANDQAPQQVTLKDGDQDHTPVTENKTSADEETFFQWMAENSPDSDFITIRAYYKSLNELLVGRGILPQPIASIKDEGAIARAEAWADKVIKGEEFRKTAVWLLQEYKQYLGKAIPSNVCQCDNTAVVSTTDNSWLPILKESFIDGYILDDFLSQFQAAAYWQERYGKACPIEGSSIDEAMKAVGSVRDGRVFAKNDKDNKLIFEICERVNYLLSQYTCVYRSCIYEHYSENLAACSIYTEPVMTQLLLAAANGKFYSIYQVFARRGQESSVTHDCRKVLRDHGGAMNVSDIENELWFIPREIVHHSLYSDNETINIGTGVWMLAEQFPLTIEDANMIGDMLDECFVNKNFVQQSELMLLIGEHLPSIADNLSGLHFQAVFNILSYYLKNRFDFSKAIITPKGAKTEFRDLFQSYAQEHDHFTVDELSAFAAELKVPIYWESTFSGGSVRISGIEFVNRRLITFDIDATDKVLESICQGDYVLLHDISPAMMLHLPPCGYSWNGYLLLSYVFGFSKVFRLLYNSLGKTDYYGAMVKRDCLNIDCYDRLVERILTDDDTWTNEDEALDLLVKKGLQAQRRLKGIDKLIVRARQNKIAGGR